MGIGPARFIVSVISVSTETPRYLHRKRTLEKKVKGTHDIIHIIFNCNVDLKNVDLLKVAVPGDASQGSDTHFIGGDQPVLIDYSTLVFLWE